SRSPDRAGDLQADARPVPHADRPRQRRDRLHHSEASVGRKAPVLLWTQAGSVWGDQQRWTGRGTCVVRGVQEVGCDERMICIKCQRGGTRTGPTSDLSTPWSTMLYSA